MTITITTLIENSLGKDLSLHNEHGLSFLIQYDNYNILFDTGRTNKFIYNAQKLNVDLRGVTHVVMSHGHYDHTGGFKDFVDINSSFELYTSKYFFDKKYSLNNSDYYFKGINFNEYFLDSKSIKRNYISDNTVEILPNFFLSTKFRSQNQYEKIDPKFHIKQGDEFIKDDFKDELVLSIKTNLGLIVILGCSHVGVVNILETLIEEFGETIYCVIGGTHLVEADEEQIKFTMDYFRHKDIQHLGICHCTGEKAMNSASNMIFPNSTGTKIQITSGRLIY